MRVDMTNVVRSSQSFVLAVTAAAAGFLVGGCSRPHAETPSTADLPTVAAAKATRADLTENLQLAAEFRPFQEIEVHAKVAGFLKEIRVDVGDRVKAGQLLATLEVPELQDELRQDDAGVRRSEQEIRRAQADLERAESNHQGTHLATTRLSDVARARPKLIAQQDLDDATARDRMAEAQVATARAALAAAEQQLEALKAGQSKTQTLFDYARITAPFAGVITHRYADTGAMIQAGTSSQSQAMPVVRLSQNDRLRLIIPVPESAVARIHLGEPVEVRVDALRRTFPGTIARFSDTLSAETRTMQTEVDVPNRSLELVPGMYAYATIALDTATHVLTVPVQAIDHTGDKASVMAVSNGHIAPRDVKTGMESPDRVEITSGLDDGDLVVVGNRAQLRPGMAVSARVSQ